jgi:hypothetical protein
MSAQWQLVAVTDNTKAKAFQKKFWVPLTAKFRHMPESFARLLAKIAYCHLLTVLDPGDFRPICLPYILGDRKNPSYVVGGTFDIAEPEAVGYRLSTCCFGSPGRLMLVAEIRLFANASTPTYHVVVGDVFGIGNIAAVLQKIGEIIVLPAGWPQRKTTGRHGFGRCRSGQMKVQSRRLKRSRLSYLHQLQRIGGSGRLEIAA